MEKTKKEIKICDISLRDGNHAVKHQLTKEHIKQYCQFAESAGLFYVEVGHGNGLGASSLLIGEALLSDEEMLQTARDILQNTKLGVHIIPGFATVHKHVQMAIDYGVDIFRVASHCTEANMTKVAIEFLCKANKEVHGVLMMSPLAPYQTLLAEAKKMQSYGAKAIIIMDSTGSFLPSDLQQLLPILREGLEIEVGFHAHNNLGCAVGNSLAAVENGASMLDACIRGFGAGAGNTPLEVMLAALQQSKYRTGVDLNTVILQAETVLGSMVPANPCIEPIHILTGLNKLFSGFSTKILELAKTYGIPYPELTQEISKRKLIAGQEDLLVEIALELQKSRYSHD